MFDTLLRRQHLISQKSYGAQKGKIFVYVKVYGSLLDLFWILKASKSVVKNIIQSNQDLAK